MVTEVNAVTFRQNPGEMLNQVQRAKEGILIEDGQPRGCTRRGILFARISALRDHFDRLNSRLAGRYSEVSQAFGLAEIEGAAAARSGGSGSARNAAEVERKT